MKLLISAYACGPNLGSEEGLGWNWTTEAHRLGHDVWVLTSPVFRDAIEEACRAGSGLEGLHWFFPEVHGWPVGRAIKPKWERTYCLLWQRAALRRARALQHRVGFDAVHHLTWAGLRVPTFLGLLDPPLILGPLGGGETSPRVLRDGFPLRGRVVEWIRDFSNATVMINPLIRRELRQAAVICASTPDTRNLFPHDLKRQTFVFSQVAAARPPSPVARPVGLRPPRLLYAGRLLYWKGVHIAIDAFAQLLKRLPDARLTIVGEGPEKYRLQRQARARSVDHRVVFTSGLPQTELFGLYDTHDLFLFPSLHDSGGFVIVEALAHGLPVICLNLGGPSHIVTPKAGVVVATADRNTAQVATAIADEICCLLADPVRLAALSDGAVARARDFTLRNRVTEFYNRATEFISLANIGGTVPGSGGEIRPVRPVRLAG
jgi:glycosyltransferase involved in cell wall biosynthesis